MILKSMPNLNFVNSVRYIATQRTSIEVKVPIAAGYMAGKWWGPTDRRPILALHGWQDSCGTFDRLIPLLPPQIPVLALDYFGHGFSSRMPPGIAYHDINNCIYVKEIKNYFGWDKITILGHSMGGIITFLYGALFPNEVDLGICIDRVYPLLTNKKDLLAQSIEEFIRYDKVNKKTGEPPSYAYEEIVKRVHLGSKKSINAEVAKYIFYRNIMPSKTNPGTFYFSRDPRVKVGPMDRHDPQEILRIAPKITFPLLICRGEGSVFFGRHSLFDEMRDIFMKNSRDFRYFELPGLHHFHLNNPERLAEIISDFLLKHDRDDRISGFRDELKVDESIYPIYKYKEQILNN